MLLQALQSIVLHSPGPAALVVEALVQAAMASKAPINKYPISVLGSLCGRVTAVQSAAHSTGALSLARAHTASAHATASAGAGGNSSAATGAGGAGVVPLEVALAGVLQKTLVSPQKPA